MEGTTSVGLINGVSKNAARARQIDKAAAWVEVTERPPPPAP